VTPSLDNSLPSWIDQVVLENLLILKKKYLMKIFEEDEHISVSQIYDLTGTKIDQLGMNKIGWRKAIRVAVRHYIYNHSITYFKFNLLIFQ
jgi:hypothetical protein